MQRPYDVAVIGAGAAGMMAAATAGQGGARVVLIDHAASLAEKIRISGGGRCNFTNLEAHRPERFLSENPRFARNALAAFKPRDFLELLQSHHIRSHEKHKGQLFCDESSEQIIDLLRTECEDARVAWRRPCTIAAVERSEHNERGFVLATDGGRIEARRLIVATGGLSIPKIGASDFGFRLARQFGLRIVEPRPALVPLTFSGEVWKPFVELAGLSLEVTVKCGRGSFDEDLLFTHRGLSGPAILQISSYWNPGEPLLIDLAPAWPGESLAAELLAKKAESRQTLANVLALIIPRRLAEGWLALRGDPAASRISEVPDRVLRQLAESLKRWTLVPNGTEGFRKAEVTRGGVATDELDPRTLEAKKAPGLYFVGEVVDVTGWLGGYNFQWAWASGVAAGRAAAG
ncbi:MAG: NAD(P)/FAD-dependent oxidoreductase [Burkholderiaceae bacterium]